MIRESGLHKTSWSNDADGCWCCWWWFSRLAALVSATVAAAVCCKLQLAILLVGRPVRCCHNCVQCTCKVLRCEGTLQTRKDCFQLSVGVENGGHDTAPDLDWTAKGAELLALRGAASLDTGGCDTAPDLDWTAKGAELLAPRSGAGLDTGGCDTLSGTPSAHP